MTITKTERVYIGHVGVDSGQLVIMDPCYVESSWRRGNEAEISGVSIWGAEENIEPILSNLRSMGYDALSSDWTPHKYEIDVSDMGHPQDEVIQILTVLDRFRVDNVRFAWSLIRKNSTYDQICEMTLSEDQVGGLAFPAGHSGMLVAFTSGFGDGLYDVYATWVTFSNGDNRIAKVEIELIDLEELGRGE